MNKTMFEGPTKVNVLQGIITTLQFIISVIQKLSVATHIYSSISVQLDPDGIFLCIFRIDIRRWLRRRGTCRGYKRKENATHDLCLPKEVATTLICSPCLRDLHVTLIVKSGANPKVEMW